MKIIITKEEAINAWKDMNADLRLSKDTVIEIENTSLGGNGTTTYPMPYVADISRGTGGAILCGDATNNN